VLLQAVIQHPSQWDDERADQPDWTAVLVPTLLRCVTRATLITLITRTPVRCLITLWKLLHTDSCIGGTFVGTRTVAPKSLLIQTVLAGPSPTTSMGEKYHLDRYNLYLYLIKVLEVQKPQVGCTSSTNSTSTQYYYYILALQV
jgi:hypothetical protein